MLHKFLFIVFSLLFSMTVFGQEKTEPKPSQSPTSKVDFPKCEKQGSDCEIAWITYSLVNRKRDQSSDWEWLDSMDYQSRGELYYEKGDFSRALADFNKVDSLLPSYCGGVMRGNIYYRRGNNERAFADYKCATSGKYGAGTQANAYLGIGNIYFQKMKYELAMENYDRAIELNRRLAEAYLGRGNIYLQRKDYKMGLDEINTALEVKPDYVEAYRRRAFIYEKLGETAKAEFDRQQADLFENANKKP